MKVIEKTKRMVARYNKIPNIIYNMILSKIYKILIKQIHNYK